MKVECEGKLQLSKSNLNHSTNDDGKTRIKKKSYSLLSAGESLSFGDFLFGKNCFLTELSQIKYFWDSSLTIL